VGSLSLLPAGRERAGDSDRASARGGASAGIGGEWSRETDCVYVTCDPSFVTIPTVSAWGLVILALVLLIGGKIWLGGRVAVDVGK